MFSYIPTQYITGTTSPLTGWLDCEVWFFGVTTTSVITEIYFVVW